MALVRCTCLGRLDAARGEWRVDVADPDCGYVVHRLAGPAVPEDDGPAAR